MKKCMMQVLLCIVLLSNAVTIQGMNPPVGNQTKPISKEFRELYTCYAIIIARQTTNKDFYDKLLPYEETPEIRKQITAVVQQEKSKGDKLLFCEQTSDVKKKVTEIKELKK